jgi:hypothetical protein
LVRQVLQLVVPPELPELHTLLEQEPVGQTLPQLPQLLRS